MLLMIHEKLWKQLEDENKAVMMPWVESLAKGIMGELKKTKGTVESGHLTWADFRDYHKVMRREKDNFVEAIEMKLVAQKNALFTNESDAL